MIDKWIHIEYLSEDPWVLPINGAINEAVKKVKMTNPFPELGETTLDISTRLNMLPRIIKRLNKECYDVYQEIRSKYTEEHLTTKSKEGYPLEINNDLTYYLLIDIDSLLFELNALCKFINKLFYKLCGVSEENVGKEIKKIIGDAGEDPTWFKKLDSHRNFFTHEGSPYLAVDYSNEDTLDLLIMKRNLRAFDNPEDFFTCSELSEIVEGFSRSKGIIQEYLIHYLKNL